jgi:hypothetical protein
MEVEQAENLDWSHLLGIGNTRGVDGKVQSVDIDRSTTTNEGQTQTLGFSKRVFSSVRTVVTWTLYLRERHPIPLCDATSLHPVFVVK